MTRTLPLILLGSLISLAVTPAESAESHFHAGVALGRSSVDGRAEVPARITLSPIFPSDIPLGGLAFDDHDTAWSVFVGYEANQYLGVELGFWNHGRFDSRFTGPDPISLSIKEAYFGATLSYPLFERFALTASAGVSRAQFDADGSVALVVLAPGAPIPFPIFPPGGFIANLPVVSPEDETGGYWRVGLDWRLSNSLQAGLDYGRRDLQVLQVESLSLSLQYTF